MTDAPKEVVVPTNKLIREMNKNPEVADQLRRAGEQEVFREKLKQNAHLKRFFSHHPETIIAETRESISDLSHTIARVLGQRGVKADWFNDVTVNSKAEEVLIAPTTYLRKALEIADELSPERDKLDGLMSKDPVIIEAAKIARLATLAKEGKLPDPTARDRILTTAIETERNRRAHIARKYELELLNVWGRELKLMRLRQEVLELENIMMLKLRSAVLDSISELAKIAETPEAEELLEQAKALRTQASFDANKHDNEPVNLDQVQTMRNAVQEGEKHLVKRIEKNEETIEKIMDIEKELLGLLPTLNAKAEWKPVHRAAKKSGYSSGPGASIKHRGRMAIRDRR